MLDRVLAARRVPGAGWEALREADGTTVERAAVAGRARGERLARAWEALGR
ncbi:MAG TPA: hypothetical protein VK601_28840 [Kofleriaceae bacterium]|nr:hypothetical protein [Kofleriaceae bacterium]